MKQFWKWFYEYASAALIIYLNFFFALMLEIKRFFLQSKSLTIVELINVEIHKTLFLFYIFPDCLYIWLLQNKRNKQVPLPRMSWQSFTPLRLATTVYWTKKNVYATANIYIIMDSILEQCGCNAVLLALIKSCYDVKRPYTHSVK